MRFSAIKDIIFVVVILILMFVCSTQCNKANKVSEQYSAALGESITYRNKLNQEVTERKVIQATAAELKAMISTKDSTLAKLQKIVSRRTETAIVISNATEQQLQMATDVTFYNEQDTIECNPVYSSEYNDAWTHVGVIAMKDTTMVSVKVTNSYDIETEWKRKHFLARPELKATITNTNPNTVTKEFIVYQEKSPGNAGLVLTGLGLSFSLGIVAALTLFR